MTNFKWAAWLFAGLPHPKSAPAALSVWRHHGGIHLWFSGIRDSKTVNGIT